VKIQRENQTLATITFQNYFACTRSSRYDGTADTEAPSSTRLQARSHGIPTNRVLQRKEFQDVVYRTEEEKFRNARPKSRRGTPRASRSGGTISVEKSERLGGILKKIGVPHVVLNAKNHEREAHIVAQAGRKARHGFDHMAGRGTDILLAATRSSSPRKSSASSRRIRIFT